LSTVITASESIEFSPYLLLQLHHWPVLNIIPHFEQKMKKTLTR